MKLKNYTSGVSAGKSIQAIEKILVYHGATNILKEYGPDGELSAIAFMIKDPKAAAPENREGRMSFKLYARIDVVEKLLKEEVRRPRKETYKKIADQAEKTAWKILYDAIASQMALVDLGQREILAVFLADAYDTHKRMTLFEKIQSGQLKQLMAGTNEG
jgi:hypothetical protein